jgi:hypothetical protein
MLRTGRSGARIPAAARDCFFSKIFKPALANDEFPIQRETLSSWLRRPRPEDEHSTLPNVEIKISGAISPHPLYAFMVCRKTTLPIPEF